MEPKVLFALAQSGATSEQLTTGPDSGKKWIITTLYICNKGAVTATVTLTHGHPAATDFTLLNTASLQQGETVNLGSLVMENGDDMDVETIGAAMDFVAYGYEDDVVV